MRLGRRVIVVVVLGWLFRVPALGGPPPRPTPTLARATHRGWLRFQVISGRITVAATRYGSSSSRSTGSNGTEKLNIRVSNAQLSMTYERSAPQEDFSIEVSSSDRLRVRRTGKGDTAIVPVEFTQAPGEPISLRLGGEDRQHVYRAATLWHLLIAQPEACRQHLVPLLKLLRSDWRLAETAAAMETKLLQVAAAGQLPNRRRWDRLVEQLADDRFSRREAADRQLRSAGRAVLSYLRGLDFDRLEAEQQFRIRRIIASVSRQSGDDTAEGFAPQLLTDPELWLALLSRREESIRRVAARHLEAVLGEPVRFDPAADPTTRKNQIERLKARVRAKGPEANS